jgi:hypothetical protein
MQKGRWNSFDTRAAELEGHANQLEITIESISTHGKAIFHQLTRMWTTHGGRKLAVNGPVIQH